MKKAFLASLVLLVFAYMGAGFSRPAAPSLDGLWVATVSGDQIRFRLTVFGDSDREEWNTSLTVARTRLSGLEFEKDHSFSLKGDAGTITFHGKFSGTRGLGSFDFVADTGFVEFLAAKKFGRIDDKKLIFFLIGDIDKAYIQYLGSLGYTDISSSRLVDLAIHRVSRAYIDEMQALWGPNLSLSKIVEFRIHGITKEYSDEMARAGFKDLTPSKVLELKIHGLTADYIKDVRSAGFPDLSLQKVLEFKIHGIDKAYIEYCRELFKGRREITPEFVVRLKINGI